MWGGPTPHNLVILCLCYANQTRSEVPISSSNRDTARLGRGDRILLPSVIPAQVQGRHNTTRSTLTIGYPLRIQRRQTRRRITPGIPPFLAVASADRTQQGISGWPVQSPRHPQELILSQRPRRKQKKRAISNLCSVCCTMEFSCKYITILVEMQTLWQNTKRNVLQLGRPPSFINVWNVELNSNQYPH